MYLLTGVAILLSFYYLIIILFLSAQSSTIESNTTLLMADIKVFCTNSSVKEQLLNKIKSSLPSVPLFDSNYVEVVDTAGKSSKLVAVFFQLLDVKGKVAHRPYTYI